MKLLKDPVRWYRLARRLRLLCLRLLPTFIRMWFFCVLPHTAELGNDVVLGYGGLGVVIHKNAKIGSRVHINQGVTIGGNVRVSGIPTIGDDVSVGCGAKLLGPICIRKGAVIGANAVVNNDIPPNCVAVGIPARVIKDST